MKLFTPQNIIDVQKIIIEGMPDNYSVKKIRYKTKENCWNVIRLEITNLTNKSVVNIYRNYHSIDFICAKQNGQDFLITSEDYQGFAIINLSKMEKNLYIPESALNGTGWCPIEFTDWDEEENTLICVGCVWACPYSQRTYSNLDLTNPDFDKFEEYWDFDDEDEDKEEDSEGEE